MHDKVDNLVLEQLRAMRSDSMRLQMAAIVTLQEHDHTDLAAVKTRLDRIERRLELVDGTD